MDTARNELIKLIMKLPEREILPAKRFLEFLLGKIPSMTDEEYLQFLEQTPEDDEEPWTEEDERDIEQAKKEIAEGKYITLEDFARKHAHGN